MNSVNLDDNDQGVRHPGAVRDGDLIVDIDGFEGPLDVLLMLARSQKVDLKNISLLQLADQYLAFISAARKRSLDLAAEYLVMAAWLAYLKSRILLPEPVDEEPGAEDMATALVDRLRALEAMRNAGERLMARPILGRDVFGRGAAEGIMALTKTLLNVTLYDLLKTFAAHVQRKSDSPLTFEPMNLYSVEQALENLTRMLGLAPGWQKLQQFLPTELQDSMVLRSAVAATFAAALELARLGRVQIRQKETFGSLYLRPSPAGNHEDG